MSALKQGFHSCIVGISQRVNSHAAIIRHVNLSIGKSNFPSGIQEVLAYRMPMIEKNRTINDGQESR
jgi:hypothetical protein